MKKGIKWALIAGGALIALVIVALLVIPIFVDIQKYKPEIEKKVSEATGRPFTLGGNFSLSLFPWAGLSFTDLHLGNPPGFEEKDFLSIKSFEVRVKLLPLISKDIQVKRFVMAGPRITLEKNKDGRGNWEGLGKPSGNVPPVPTKKKGRPPEKKPEEGLPIKALAVGEFAITKGAAIWIDHMKVERKEVSDINLRLQDVSLDRPVKLAFSANLDGRPLSLEGKVGPVGRDPGKGTLAVDLSIKLLKQLEIAVKGNIVDPLTRQQFDLAIQVSPFSPRKLMAALGQAFPVKTTDPEVLNLVALKSRIKGNPGDISISDGVMDLDQSKLKFSKRVKEFSKPDVAFDLNLDKIDLDRYLPPPGEKKPPEEKKKDKTPASGEKKTDYTPLRKLVLDGVIRVGMLKAKGVNIQDLHMKVAGKNGLFRLDPVTLNLYQGDMSSKGNFDVRENIPKSNVELKAKGIQAGPLLRDLLKKDFLEGTAKADIAIRMEGDDAETIKKTLNGEGDLLFKDGAVKGIDLAGMVRNVKTTFGLAEKSAEKPRTDFSEFHAPFTITNGVVKTPETGLISPILRVLAAGKADLVKESLDFRVEPKFVGTIKGQGDTKQRTGITVPVLVTGSFSSPKFRPDLKGMFQQTIEKGISDPSKLKDMLKGGSEEKDEAKPVEDQVKGLLKGFKLGR